MSGDFEYNYDGPSEGTVGPDSARSCGAYDPANLYLAAKNLVEADGFMVIVYILAILGKLFSVFIFEYANIALRDA